ncbi:MULTISPECIES: Fic family protein [Pseudoalteromonas]|uniref:Fido domain-containing protein n=1 Tax=Pseudoalteromonas luteoviolacea (strain 2ta16) TaxID=1353533 RepID=V4HID7_PSEL2|nr:MULTISPECIES: Fic family protein [Pseudoalteromonas]ESP90550.1 hypothetical protein PL2TA16_01654 [Pseudoalteromonas luteoviolacea 2ta16]KZN41879.1 hypothetical protein N483_14505 [Pseudoalteromonas luteoviolacea NCIMB 1944]MCG7550475.1 Fic family protein [Pseudoalteromonas sp. Of7M-16]
MNNKIVNSIIINLISRYLAGGSSLRETRNITRKQLALTNCGVGFIHPGSQVQTELNLRFMKAVEIFNSSGINISTLSQVNSIFLNRKTSIRTSGVKIATPSQELEFKPPSADKLQSLLTQMQIDIAEFPVISIQQAICFYTQLIKIHPFSDANGRTARAMVCAMLINDPSAYISFLYRLNANKEDYIAALDAYTLTSKEYIDSTYWDQAQYFGKQVAQLSTQVILETHKSLTTQFTLSPDAKNCVLLIEHLWLHPIVYPPKLASHLKLSEIDLDKAIDELVKRKILVPRAMRNPKGAVVLECPKIMSAWAQIDNQFLQR